ncbi:MAG: hypothetical protein AAF587_27870 [Bacteroidota bacterium]
MSINKIYLFIIWILCSFSVHAQQQDSVEQGIADRIFNSYLEVGLLAERSPQLGTGLILKSAFEYRWKGVNHPFIRFNFDQYDPIYHLNSAEDPGNILNEAASITDMLLGPGYRFGKQALRMTVAFQAGIKSYTTPIRITETTPDLIYMEGGNWIPASRLTAGMEYYLDDFFAISLELFQNQAWSAVDYWKNRKTAFGISIGLVGTFF